MSAHRASHVHMNEIADRTEMAGASGCETGYRKKKCRNEKDLNNNLVIVLEENAAELFTLLIAKFGGF